MDIKDVRQAFSDSKQLCLTSLQVIELISFADMDANQTIDVAALDKLLKGLITNMFTVEPMRRKA